MARKKKAGPITLSPAILSLVRQIDETKREIAELKKGHKGVASLQKRKIGKNKSSISFRPFLLKDILGPELLASLLKISKRKLEIYIRKPKTIPEEVFLRLAFVVEVTEILKGAYNDTGIRQWFLRKRIIQLNRQSPAQILKYNWLPDQPGPLKILELAKSINI